MNYPATVSSFRLDKYEVTVGRFRVFLEAGMGTQASPPMPDAGAHAHIAGSGWDANWNASLTTDTAHLVTSLKCEQMLPTPTHLATWTDLPSMNEDRPMNCLTWYEAMAFCIWDGGYLPTEAEWNYAAAGGDQQRAYPWSSRAAPLQFDTSRASYGIFSGTGPTCLGDGSPACDVTDLIIVGSKPAGDGRWSHSDLAGNVFEWTLDWKGAMYPVPCADCADLAPMTFRAVRGGCFSCDPSILRTSVRSDYGPMVRTPQVGVRCARPSI